VGGLTGGILNASKSSKEIKQGVISGATGAMTAEIAGEYLIPIKDQAFIQKKTQDIAEEEYQKTGEYPSQERLVELFKKEVQPSLQLAHMIGASAGAFIGKDANTAYWTAQNALDNNMLSLLLKEFLKYGGKEALKQGGKELLKQGGKEGLKKTEKIVKVATQLIKQAPSTTGGPDLEPEKDPKKEGEKKEEEKEEKNSPQNVTLHEKYKQELRQKEIESANRLGSAVQKNDPYHRGASFGITKDNKLYSFEILGQDGNKYTLYQQRGQLEKNNGVFEYIRNMKGDVLHQRFIKNGEITGTPNQIIKK
jgi:hypothetical protein